MAFDNLNEKKRESEQQQQKSLVWTERKMKFVSF